MCTAIAVESLSAWLASQERMLRAWCGEASLDPGIDADLAVRLQQHCAWMSEQLYVLDAGVRRPQ